MVQSGPGFYQLKIALGSDTARWSIEIQDYYQAAGPALKDVQQAHRDDPEAQQRAMRDVYRSHGVHPLSSCPWQIPGIVIPSLPALWSPRRQTAYDGLAGILVVSQK